MIDYYMSNPAQLLYAALLKMWWILALIIAATVVALLIDKEHNLTR